jgi:hypothetical protein
VLGDDIADLDSRVAGVVTSACQMSRTTNQSIADSTDTYISFPIENLDIGGWFPGSGTTVTVPAGAVPAGATTIALWLTGSAKFATNGTGTRRIEIHVNGSSIGGQNVPGLSGDNTIVYIAGELAVVAAGDTIKLSASQTSGGALNVLTAKLQFHRIGVVS